MMISKVRCLYTQLLTFVNCERNVPFRNTHCIYLTDHGRLFYLVHERMEEVVKDCLEPHLWVYRPRITLEHLMRYMQQHTKKYPILREFLEKVCTYYGMCVHLHSKYYDAVVVGG